MMFTLTYTPDAYRIANNLQLGGNGLYESRPGFFQVVSDNINRAIGWNDACLMEIFGGVYVWHGGIFEAIKDATGQLLTANLKFSGTRFQGLQSLGNREERIYIGNGKSLYYLHRKVIAGGNVTAIELTPKTVELLVNTIYQLSAIIEPAWALNKAITWTSSDNGIVSVDDAGTATGLKPGNAIITATTEDGGFSDSCTLTVTPYVVTTGITMAPTVLTLKIDEEQRLTWQVLPEEATDTDIYWLVDDTAICLVKEWGAVIGLSEGVTVVRCRTKKGHFEAQCRVSVVLEQETQTVAGRSMTAVGYQPAGGTPRNKTTVQFYEAVFFENEFLDDDNQPFALPKAQFVATWRNRIWAGDGTHIIYHCQNDKPHHWEPLDAIAIQGGYQSGVTGLCPFGNKLMVSTPESLWQIVGDSPYNWEFQTVVTGQGAVNDRAMVSDGHRLFYLDWHGVYQLGQTAPLSEAIAEAFYSPDFEAQIILDAQGEYLYLLIQQRLFVLNTWAGGWGEILHPVPSNTAIKGLILIGGQVAMYGESGLWIMGSQYTPDVWFQSGMLEWGKRAPVVSTIRTWPVQPNHYGMASLNRMYVSVEGFYQGSTVYSVYPGENQSELASQEFKNWLHSPREILIRQEPLQVICSEQSQRVYLEAPLEVSGPQFEHQLMSCGYVRYHRFDPVYFFTERRK